MSNRLKAILDIKVESSKNLVYVDHRNLISEMIRRCNYGKNKRFHPADKSSRSKESQMDMH